MGPSGGELVADFAEFLEVFHGFFVDGYNAPLDSISLQKDPALASVVEAIASRFCYPGNFILEAVREYRDIYPSEIKFLSTEDEKNGFLRSIYEYSSFTNDQRSLSRSRHYTNLIDRLFSGGFVLGRISSSVLDLDYKDGLWDAALHAEGVPPRLRSDLIKSFRTAIARASRPKWVDRLDHRELRTLTAPAFLKAVHAADIGEDGSVSTEVIRAIDPDLMKAVEMYLGQRRRRNAGPGDADGLNLVMQRPRLPRPHIPAR